MSALWLPDNRLLAPELLMPGQSPRSRCRIKVDRTHPVGSIITYCNLFDSGSRNIVSGIRDTVYGGVEFGAQGAAFNLDNGTDDYIICDPTVDFDQQGNFTVFIRHRPGAPTSPYPALIGRGDTGLGEWMIRWWSSDGTLRAYGNGGSLNITSATSIVTVDELQTAALVYAAGTGWTLYHNGVSVGTSASTFTVSTGADLRLGWADTDANRHYEGILECAFGIPMALSPKDISSLHANSYQFVVPA